MNDRVLATGIGFQTCLGTLGTRDIDEPGGINCFEVLCTDGQARKIVNFYVENLEKLIRKGLTWPIECTDIGRGRAVIDDHRIGERWYEKRYCETCCPKDLLPFPQRAAQLRDIRRGRRKEMDGVTVITDKKSEFE